MQVLAVRGLVTPVIGSLRAGDQITLVAALDADQGAVPDVRWASDNPGVATVSSGGVVTGVGPGSAVVRATAVADARISASALLTIMPARSVRIVGAPATLWMGDEATLNSSVDVDSTQSRDVVWSSSQPAVASISDAGVVTAITTGTTTLRSRPRSIRACRTPCVSKGRPVRSPSRQPTPRWVPAKHAR